MGFLGIIAILVSLYDTYDPFINKKSNRNDKFIVFAESRFQVGIEKLCSWISRDFFIAKNAKRARNAKKINGEGWVDSVIASYLTFSREIAHSGSFLFLRSCR